MDLRDSSAVRWLYRRRGLPSNGMTLDGMLKWGFVLLAEIDARWRVLLLMNVAKGRLDDVLGMLPTIKRPTVVSL